jgi:hypothetical protein
MSQQAYWFKSNGDYVVTHNGGKDYHITKFKRLSSVADYLLAHAADRGHIDLEADIPPYLNATGQKIEFPNYWEVQALKDEMAVRSAPGQTRDLETRTVENEEDFVEESTKSSILGNAITMISAIIKF